MDISLFDIVENGISNNEIVEIVTTKLEEKYNKKFTVKRIGNRYGIRDDNFVTTYCSPEDNEDLIFSVFLNKTHTEFRDDYQLRSVSFELEKNIQDTFKA